MFLTALSCEICFLLCTVCYCGKYIKGRDGQEKYGYSTGYAFRSGECFQEVISGKLVKLTTGAT